MRPVIYPSPTPATGRYKSSQAVMIQTHCWCLAAVPVAMTTVPQTVSTAGVAAAEAPVAITTPEAVQGAAPTLPANVQAPAATGAAAVQTPASLGTNGAIVQPAGPLQGPPAGAAEAESQSEANPKAKGEDTTGAALVSAAALYFDSYGTLLQLAAFQFA